MRLIRTALGLDAEHFRTDPQIVELSYGHWEGQQLQKQIGQTGIPVYNVANACATGATAVRTACLDDQGGRGRHGRSRSASSRWARWACSARRRSARRPERVRAEGRYGSVMSVEGVLGTGAMPGVFAQAGMEYAVRERRRRLRAVRQGRGEEPRALDAQPARAVPEGVLARRGHGRRDDVVPEHAADVLPDRRRCRRGRARVARRSCARCRTSSSKRAVKISASVLTTDPWTERRQVAARRQHAHPQRGATQAYETRGRRSRRTSTSSSCTTASRPPSSSTTTTCGLCEPGEAGKFIDERGPWRDGKIPVNVSGGLISKGHPIGATGVANVYEVATHLRGEAGDRQIEGAKVGLTHVIGLGSACAIHILEKAAV